MFTMCTYINQKLIEINNDSYGLVLKTVSSLEKYNQHEKKKKLNVLFAFPEYHVFIFVCA